MGSVSRKRSIVGPALTTYAAIVLCILAPIWLSVSTAPGSALPNWGQLSVMVLAGFRFAMILGSRTRRLHEMVFWLFTYVFMGMAPYVQARMGASPSTTPHIEFGLATQAAVIVLVGIPAFIVGTKFGNHRHLKAHEIRAVNPRRANLLAGFALIFAAYYAWQTGLGNFLKSRAELDAAQAAAWPDSTVTIVMIAGVSMSLLVAFVSQIHIREMKRRAGAPKPVVLPVTLLLSLMFLVNPISSPRYVFGMCALAVLGALGAYATLARFRVLAISSVVGLVALFPLLDAFRYTLDGEVEAVSPTESLMSGDFDAFSQLVNTVEYVGVQGITWGMQLLGVLLFWVPRSIWPDKPVGTGAHLAEFKGYQYDNLSSPIWAEFYIGGGWPLLILGLALLGYIFRIMDRRAEMFLRVSRIPPVLGCIIPFFLLILLRGSLLATAAYLAVILVSAAFVTGGRQQRRLRARAEQSEARQMPHIARR